jgi:hypothetical protein
MMFGLLFSLKQFVLKLQPFSHGSKTSSYLAFRTNNYKLHVSETASGLIFLLATEPSSPEVKEQLFQCARVYDDFISKNPAACIGEPAEYASSEFVEALRRVLPRHV